LNPLSTTFPDHSQKCQSILYSTELHAYLCSNLTFHPLHHGDFGHGWQAYPITTATTATPQVSRIIPTTIPTDYSSYPMTAMTPRSQQQPWYSNQCGLPWPQCQSHTLPAAVIKDDNDHSTISPTSPTSLTPPSTCNC